MWGSIPHATVSYIMYTKGGKLVKLTTKDRGYLSTLGVEEKDIDQIRESVNNMTYSPINSTKQSRKAAFNRLEKEVCMSVMAISVFPWGESHSNKDGNSISKEGH